MIGIKTNLSVRTPARAPHARGTLVRSATAEPINPDIKKDEPKVVDMISTDDMPKKVRSRSRFCVGPALLTHKILARSIGTATRT